MDQWQQWMANYTAPKPQYQMPQQPAAQQSQWQVNPQQYAADQSKARVQQNAQEEAKTRQKYADISRSTAPSAPHTGPVDPGYSIPMSGSFGGGGFGGGGFGGGGRPGSGWISNMPDPSKSFGSPIPQKQPQSSPIPAWGAYAPKDTANQTKPETAPKQAQSSGSSGRDGSGTSGGGWFTGK